MDEDLPIHLRYGRPSADSNANFLSEVLPKARSVPQHLGHVKRLADKPVGKVEVESLAKEEAEVLLMTKKGGKV